MKGSSREFLIAFNMIPGVGGRRLWALKNHFGSLEKAWSAPRRALLAVPGWGEKTVAALCSHRGGVSPAKEEEWARALGARIITLADRGYPEFLKRLAVPPPTLYVWGKLPEKPGVAVVGTRKPSRSGIRQAQEFSGALARAGIPIISGMARGIDFYAHQSCLKFQGVTVAVLGSNLGSIYPAEHRPLAQKIALGGAVVSEFSSRCPTLPENFPRRNRIIAGLAQGVVVIQAGKKSGAVNTAYWALELGLDVWAVPGEISDPRRQGSNDLIKQGAHLLSEVGDLLSGD